ncbi:MAG: Rieske (2Fe-2S) protein [Rubrivivax sp.]
MSEVSPQPAAPGQVLCAGDELEEGGRAYVFDVSAWGQPARAFVLRVDGAVVGYLNRCAHVPAEMDWQEGQFLDGDRRFIVCSIHGALYEPADGRCVGGPCGRGRLTPLSVREEAGQVTWYPSDSIRPAFDEPAPLQAPPAA